MEAIYENTDFKHLSINKRKGNDTVHVEKDRDDTSSKRTKVLLIVLCVSVVLAVGGLCVLGVLYYHKLADFELLNKKHDIALMQLSAQEINNTIMERNLKELTANLTDRLSNYNNMETELHEFNAKYNRLKASLYDAQYCNLSMDGWTVCRGVFYFSSDKKNWSNSRDVCVSMGADLVTITSQKKQNFLESKIGETHWIGLNDLDTEGQWVWVNNQTLKETKLQFWYKRKSGQNEPDNWRGQDPAGENCASLGDWNGNLHTWFDSSCKHQKRFICEKK